MPLAALHNLVRKALGPKTPVDDYDVHVGVVAECQKRSPLTEALQQDLERRYAATVQQFKVAKTTESLAHLWKKTVDQGHVTGALWAALTHPRCDENLQQVICRNMHMYQHHAGANRQADLTDFSSLQAENALLARELGRVQARSTRFMADKAQDIQQLTTQLVQVRGDNIRKDSRLAFLNADFVALKDTIPDLESSLRLQKKLEQMAARQIELEENLRELRQKLVLAEKSLDTANAALGQKADMALAESVFTISRDPRNYRDERKEIRQRYQSREICRVRAAAVQRASEHKAHDGGPVRGVLCGAVCAAHGLSVEIPAQRISEMADGLCLLCQVE